MRNEGLMMDTSDKRETKWKNSVPPAGLSGLQKKQEGGKERVRLGQPFCWSPKQINQGPLEHTNWITQMGQEGGTHGKAATKQRQGWAYHGFRHFLKLIIRAGPSLLFCYPLICPSFSCTCLSLQHFLPLLRLFSIPLFFPYQWTFLSFPLFTSNLATLIFD